MAGPITIRFQACLWAGYAAAWQAREQYSARLQLLAVWEQ